MSNAVPLRQMWFLKSFIFGISCQCVSPIFKRVEGIFVLLLKSQLGVASPKERLARLTKVHCDQFHIIGLLSRWSVTIRPIASISANWAAESLIWAANVLSSACSG